MTPKPLQNSQATRASLLARLKDWNDEGSWQDFFHTYWRLIYSVALKAGLTESEAQDAVQDTLLAVAKNIRDFEYDRARCTFKSWLMLLTRQRIIWQLRKRPPSNSQLAGPDDSTSRTATVDKIPDPGANQLEVIWEEEWQKNTTAAAIEKIRTQVNPRQFQIFDLYVLRNWPVREVVRALQISSAQVYLAKHRVTSLLRKHLKKLNRGEATLRT